MAQDYLHQVQALSAKIIDSSRSALLLHAHFLSKAIYLLEPENHPSVSCISTDGVHYYYNSFYILKCFKQDGNRVTRDYLHTLLHCIFHHFATTPLLDHALWDLSCDIAAEYLIESFDYDMLSCPVIEKEQYPFFSALSRAVPSMSAEKIYQYFSQSDLPPSDIESMQEVFCRDDHFLWYAGENGNAAQSTCVAWDTNSVLMEKWSAVLQDLPCTLNNSSSAVYRAFQKVLAPESNPTPSYISFLKRFAAPREALIPDPDTFDYTFYTYGLTLYHNLPLIEPVEYTLKQQIRDFVIALDTSGSISPKQIEQFLRITCAIIKSAEAFSCETVLHILQCDDTIQDKAVLRTEADIQHYIDTLSVKGRGETDFRPVFAYINELLEQDQLSDLCGLLYFTDGEGIFPDIPPRYETAFLLPESAADQMSAVPPWAIRFTVSAQDLLQNYDQSSAFI